MYAVRTNEADNNGADSAHNVAGVIEGVWHSEDTSSQRPLQQMDQRIHVSAPRN